jgi:hypothetical protein
MIIKTHYKDKQSSLISVESTSCLYLYLKLSFLKTILGQMAPKTRILLFSFLLQFVIRSLLTNSFEGAYFDKIAFHDSDGNSEGPYFRKVEFHKLEGSSIQITAVHDDFQCLLNCKRSPECLSLNFADQPNKDGLYECVLLRNETSDSAGLLRPSHVYHHYTRLVVGIFFVIVLDLSAFNSLLITDIQAFS